MWRDEHYEPKRDRCRYSTTHEYIISYLTLGFLVVTALSTGWYASTASDAESRQLRAYVSLLSVEFSGVAVGNEPVSYFKIKNFGQTPAYHLRHWAFVAIDHYPLNGS